MIRSVLTLAGLLVGCIGIGLFIAIGVYVWTLKSEVNRQTDILASRANGVGDEADGAIRIMREVIQKADNDLGEARGVAALQPAQPTTFMERLIARKASQQLAGSVERAQGAVVTASDAVVVAEAAVKVFSANPEIKELLRIQPSQMDVTKNVLGNVAGELRQAQNILGGPPTQEQLTAVDGALRQARNFTDDLSNVVSTARGRVNDAKSSLDRWSLRIAIATSLISALAAVGQFFLARFCWRTLCRLPA